MKVTTNFDITTERNKIFIVRYFNISRLNKDLLKKKIQRLQKTPEWRSKGRWRRPCSLILMIFFLDMMLVVDGHDIPKWRGNVVLLEICWNVSLRRGPGHSKVKARKNDFFGPQWPRACSVRPFCFWICRKWFGWKSNARYLMKVVMETATLQVNLIFDFLEIYKKQIYLRKIHLKRV